MMNKHFISGTLALILAMAASVAQAQGIVDSIVSAAESASGGWMNTALGYARNLFFGLAAIEFVWAGTQLLLQKGELSEAVVGLLMKIVTISFFGMLLTMAPTWIPAVMDSFKLAGQGISGAPSLSPSSVIDQGVNVAATMVDKGMGINGGMLENAFGDGLGKWLLSAIIIGLSGLIVIIAYTIVAIQMAITLIEMYMIIGGGALMLGFMGSRWTMNFGEKLFGYAVSIGAKLLTIYLVVGFGQTLTDSIIQHIQNIAANNGGHLGFSDFLGVGGASLAYGAIGYLVPGLAGSMLNGSPSLSMSNVSAAGKGVASMPVNAALAGGAAGAQMLGGAASLASKFGGSSAGSITGTPGGGSGSAGSIFGAPGGGKGGSSSPSAGSISNAPFAGGKDGGGASAPSGGKDSGKGGSGSTSDGKSSGGGGKGNGETTDRSKMNGQAQDTGKNAGSTATAANSPTGSAPGFQNPNAGNSGPSPRSMDPDRRMHDHMLAGAGGGQGAAQQPQQGKLARLAGVLSNYSREMQYAANRQNTNMGHDGNTGSAPSIRLSI
ncbi:hypothetical protein MASR1M60_22710 [Rhodocyclaceae bacterium]